MDDLYGKINDLENQIFELQQENHLLVTKRIDSNREKDLQIARLQDQLEFASEQADTFAKALKEIYGWVGNILDGIDEDNYVFDGVRYNLKELKNSIPENAIKRAE